MQANGDIQNQTQVIVIGGSIAGLLAAQTLSRYFHQVTIIERDRLPKQPEFRHGVPQSHHLHALLKQGQNILEEIFPGFKAELAAAGAPLVDVIGDFQWFGWRGLHPQFVSNFQIYLCSRDLVEHLIRCRLEANPQVQFVQGMVTGLLADSQQNVTGVKLRILKGKEHGTTNETEQSANLVVDASGRNSQIPKWLTAMGYAPPEETKINSFLGYASRWYEYTESLQPGMKGAMIVSQAPDRKRGAVWFTVEGNRLVLTLAGIAKDYPPTDEAGFLEFAKSLRSQQLDSTGASRYLDDFIADAKPISPIYGYQNTENCRRHYEKLSHFPNGLIVLGDAFCCFNPVYGQGMTVAALEAVTLDRCLQQHLAKGGNASYLPHFSHTLHRKLSKTVDVPWMMATGEDFRWQSTEGGKQNFIDRIMQYYTDQIILAGAENPKMHQLFIEVFHLTKPPTAFSIPMW
ncbi:MAG: FAD-dependent monooxygenase [Methylacidiphilales bacterium]|nr:FAD-dependent monooxygenase [Candidatus Methylacidiphilales bacterium]